MVEEEQETYLIPINEDKEKEHLDYSNPLYGYGHYESFDDVKEITIILNKSTIIQGRNGLWFELERIA